MNNTSRFSSDELLKVLSLSHNATAIHSSMDLTVQMANDAMLAIWGKDRSVIGLPLEEALPELKGQPFIAMMQAVLTTGISHEDVNTPANLVVNGRLQTFISISPIAPLKMSRAKPIACCIRPPMLPSAI